jgi:hypothetical protein
MCILVEEHGIPRLSVRSNGDLISHRARNHVHGILFAE